MDTVLVISYIDEQFIVTTNSSVYEKSTCQDEVTMYKGNTVTSFSEIT